MKKFLAVLFLTLLTSNVYAGGQQTLVTPDGRVLGTASNPLVVTGAGGGGISGLTTTYIPKSTSSSTIGDSAISDTSGLIGINKATATSDLDVKELNYFDLVYTYTGSYTAATSESKTTFGTAFTALFDNTQYLYLGKSDTFKDINVALRQFTTAANTLNAEYWNGSAWTTLSITDNTNNMQNSGTITYTIPGSWATTAVNGQTYYWIRLFFTSSPSTAPTIYNIRPGSNQALSVYSSVSDTTPTFQVNNGGNVLSNGVSVATPVTYVVGLATSRGGRRVDYMCTGTKDQVCINAAIAACGANPCNIVLLEGTYNITGSITPLKSNLEISGQGMGLTKIVSNNNTAATFYDITTGSSGSPLTNISIHDLEVDRSADTKDATISRKFFFAKYMRRVQVYNVYAHDSGATCIGIDFLDGAFIHHNRLEGCGTSSATTGSSGIGIGTGAYSTEPNVISDNIITGSGYAGVLIEDQGAAVESNNYVISNNVMTGGSQYGTVIRGASNITMTGNIIRSNTKDGIYIDDYGTGIVNNVLISSNIINDNTLYGINIADAGATKIKIISNDMSNNGSGTITSNMTSIPDLMRFNNMSDTVSYLESSFMVTPPSSQTIAAGNTIAADGCGTLKRVTSAGAVSTDTTNTFTAPAAGNNGCIMHVCNTGANNITLDNNANFKSAGGADVVMTADDCVTVGSTGASGVWYQLTALEAN